MSTENGKLIDSRNEKGWSVPIWVAIITGIGTVVVALIGLFGTLAGIGENSEPTYTPVPALDSIPSSTATVFLSDTSTLGPIFIASAETPSATLVATQNPVGVMYVELTANQVRGRNPLIVNFDARASYLLAPDGTKFECGACDYFWRIRINGVDIFGPEKTDGKLEYNFGGKGTYYVSVYVCRSGSDTECAGSGIEIVVE